MTDAIEQAEKKKNPSVSELVDRWESEHSKTIRENTISCYIRPIFDVKDYLGHIDISDLALKDIERLMMDLERKQYSHQSIKLRLTVINQVCDYAILNGFIDVNPCATIKAKG